MLPGERNAAVQKHDPDMGVTLITPTAKMKAADYGGRAKCLQRLIRLDMPVPRTVALSFSTVYAISEGRMPDMAALMATFGETPLVSARPSSPDPDWGGPGAILNIGMNDARHAELKGSIGAEAANALYLRFIQAYSVHVARLDPDMFEPVDAPTDAALATMLRNYEDEAEAPFPQTPVEQLGQVLKSMARAWEGTTARLLRQARGAPSDAGLGLVVQSMALGVGQPESGAGVIQFVDEETGLPQIKGRYLSQGQGRDALSDEADALYLTRDPRGPSLEERCPDLFADLIIFGDRCRTRLREEMQIEFTVENNQLSILDAVRVPRGSRADVRIAVRLAEDEIISREDALLRIAPRALSELLHRQIDPAAPRTVLAHGIAASPGAAWGQIVFTAAEAHASAARGEACVLFRRETTPEDIRGMHVADAVVTIRGGVTSHAAVIGRGLGLPCIVGASDLELNARDKVIRTPDGTFLREGDMVTVDGSSGALLAGQAEVREAALDDAFHSLLSWADEAGDIAVRANADTPADALTARNFGADGIGLCRTEHMFFEGDRLTVMREMIFADTSEDRSAALERLLPMQRADFVSLFEIMQGKPVCIRLLDPPLHEFLPSDREGMRDLAEALDLPISDVTRRVNAMEEYNPMLGLRGVRLGITVPEIYDMQVRAIFEATVEASRRGAVVVAEIMIPLVSAKREVELVKTRIDAVAAAVRNEMAATFDYRLGVMVETPRAALRADEIAQHAAFLSFGTNDLTQMAYGLSRDDAGRFMSEYVAQGVYPEDPFHTFDIEGVGELLRMGSDRGRSVRSDVVLSLCGEHGGSPAAITFCRENGFDYVSCSPFRVPVARLAAAQSTLISQ
jgi:pyruvate,orthophosphate dikinase